VARFQFFLLRWRTSLILRYSPPRGLIHKAGARLFYLTADISFDLVPTPPVPNFSPRPIYPGQVVVPVVSPVSRLSPAWEDTSHFSFPFPPRGAAFLVFLARCLKLSFFPGYFFRIVTSFSPAFFFFPCCALQPRF